jgi:hypothetical protein
LSEQQEGPEPSEPSLKWILARLARHAIHISFFALLEAGMVLLFRWLGQDKLLWARAVEMIAALYFVIDFAVLAGAELIRDIKDAYRMVRGPTSRRRPRRRQ